MALIDVCNGDADGLCAVRQWRLHEPARATLVTGLKHEIALLERVDAGAGDEVLVCDLSMQRNLPALRRLLECGARVAYFDHHAVDDIPRHPGLQAHIELGSDVCTSLLVDRALGGRFRAWALVGAYGDNLTGEADRLGLALGLDVAQQAALRRLGEAINYNAYGADEREVLIAPARLYERLARYAEPMELQAREPWVAELDARRREDLARAAVLVPHWQDARGSVLLLPDAAWSRRVVGCLANELARAEPARAHAVLEPAPAGWHVSVRAPIAMPGGASALAQRFGGSGRAAAAGIDSLPADELERFAAAFGAMRWG